MQLLGPFLGSLAAGAGTVLGAAGVYAVRRLTPRTEDALLAAAAGIMLSASFFSLLIPGLEAGESVTGSPRLGFLMVAAGILAGVLLLALYHQRTPHEHPVVGAQGPQPVQISRVKLLVMAIAIHNLPEGMAVGVGYAATDAGTALPLAIGIGVQNIPEGLAVSLSLMTIGVSRGRAFLLGSLTGLIEPVGGLLGGAAVLLASQALPFTLGFAAGAMLFVIVHEIIPETHHRGHAAFASNALFGGFVLMMGLDALLG